MQRANESAPPQHDPGPCRSGRGICKTTGGVLGLYRWVRFCLVAGVVGVPSSGGIIIWKSSSFDVLFWLLPMILHVQIARPLGTAMSDSHPTAAAFTAVVFHLRSHLAHACGWRAYQRTRHNEEGASDCHSHAVAVCSCGTGRRRRWRRCATRLLRAICTLLARTRVRVQKQMHERLEALREDAECQLCYVDACSCACRSRCRRRWRRCARTPSARTSSRSWRRAGPARWPRAGPPRPALCSYCALFFPLAPQPSDTVFGQ
jgi:hypothetical protein